MGQILLQVRSLLLPMYWRPSQSLQPKSETAAFLSKGLKQNQRKGKERQQLWDNLAFYNQTLNCLRPNVKFLKGQGTRVSDGAGCETLCAADCWRQGGDSLHACISRFRLDVRLHQGIFLGGKMHFNEGTYHHWDIQRQIDSFIKSIFYSLVLLG